MKNAAFALGFVSLAILAGCGKDNDNMGLGLRTETSSARSTLDLSLNVDSPTCRIKINNETSVDLFCKKLELSPCEDSLKKYYLRHFDCI